jgi:hypothetical protein
MQQAFILLLAPFVALVAIELTHPPPAGANVADAGSICEDLESCDIPPDVASNDKSEEKKPKAPCAKKIQEQQREIAEELRKIKDQLRSKKKKD